MYDFSGSNDGIDRIVKQTFIGYTHGMKSVFKNEHASGKVSYVISSSYIAKDINFKGVYSNTEYEDCPIIIISAEQAEEKFQFLDK